ncbi:MAG: hypothetical protein ACRENP_16100 [Longimicrobiales bacterium]
MAEPNKRRVIVFLWQVVLAGIGAAFWRARWAARGYREWQAARVSDPSVAELHHDSLVIETALAVLAAGCACAALISLVRRRARRSANRS